MSNNITEIDGERSKMFPLTPSVWLFQPEDALPRHSPPTRPTQLTLQHDWSDRRKLLFITRARQTHRRTETRWKCHIKASLSPAFRISALWDALQRRPESRRSTAETRIHLPLQPPAAFTCQRTGHWAGEIKRDSKSWGGYWWVIGLTCEIQPNWHQQVSCASSSNRWIIPRILSAGAASLRMMRRTRRKGDA